MPYNDKNLFLFVIFLALVLMVSLACGAGGGGGATPEAGSLPSEESVGLFKAKVKPANLYNAIEGDQFIVRQVGDSATVFQQTYLSSDPNQEVVVPLNPNLDYIFEVKRKNFPLFSTYISTAQLQSALSSKYLKIGHLNSFTTVLTAKLEATLRSKSSAEVRQKTEVLLSSYFNDSISDFSTLTHENLQANTISKTDSFYQDLGNRANALSVYAEVVSALSNTDNISLSTLYQSILTGTAAEWSAAAKLSSSSIPSTDNSGLNLVDKLVRNNKILTSSTTNVGLLTADELKSLFFTPDLADSQFLFELAVESPSSVINGTVDGPAKVGTEVTLIRTDGVRTSTKQTVTDENGQFTFRGLIADTYQIELFKAGHYYEEVKAKARSKSETLGVSFKSFSLSSHVDDVTIELSNSKLRVKDQGITSAKLATNLSIAGNLAIIGQTSMSGSIFPTTPGSTGQYLQTDGSGQLQWATVTIPSSGPSLSSNETITGDWVNTANPWVDNEIADALTITAGTINNTPIGATTANSGAFTTLNASSTFNVTGQANVSGILYPTTDGTANQVLRTNGQGVLSWTNAGAGSGDATLASNDTITGNWDNTANPWADNEVADALTITAGTVNNTPIGATTANSGAFTTISATGATTLNGAVTVGDAAADAITINGTVTHAAPVNFASQATTNVNIDSGAIDGAAIGANSASTGAFTTISATGATTLNGAVTVGDAAADAVTINGTVTHAAPVNFASQATTNVNIDSGAIDGAAIGANSASTGAFTTISASGTTSLNGAVGIGDAAGDAITVNGTVTHAAPVNFANQATTNVNIDSGAIDGAAIGANSASTGAFTTISASGTTSLNGAVGIGDAAGDAITVNGTVTHAAPINFANQATTNVNIDSGAIDGAAIGANSASTGAFTNVSLTGDLTVSTNTTIGNAASDRLTISANIYPGMASGNFSVSGNLISSSNIYTLGIAAMPWSAIYALDLITTSDERLKKDIEPLEYGIDEVMKLKPVSYTWKDRNSTKKTIGLLAQDVEEVIDEVVATSNDARKSMGVKYSNIVPVLIKAIQEQESIIRSQKEALKEQENRLEKIETWFEASGRLK